MSRVTFAGLVILFVIAGCEKPQSPRTPVARIDNQTLTLEEIESRFDSSQSLSQAQVHEYIQRWLIDELLYREAVRRGFDRTDHLETRLADIRRQLAIQTLLEREVYNPRTAESVQEEISAYYSAHKSEFVTSHDLALLSLALFRDRENANSFRASLLRGTPWPDAVRQARQQDQSGSQAVILDSVYYRESTLYPAELWRVASVSPRLDPSVPIRTDDGFYVLVVWKFTRRGDTPDLRYVREEIESRLAIARRQQVMDSLLANLRAKHVVQILVSSVPPDTVQLKSDE